VDEEEDDELLEEVVRFKLGKHLEHLRAWAGMSSSDLIHS